MFDDRPSTPREWPRSRETSIQSEAPDELLIRVLELAVSDACSPRGSCDCEKQCSHTDIKALAEICHRFNRIMVPLLYRTTDFAYPLCYSQTAWKELKILHRNLLKNPSLWQYYRILLLVDGRTLWLKMEWFSIANNFVSSLTKVRCLRICIPYNSDFSDQEWIPT